MGIPVKKIKVAGDFVYPATILDGVKDPVEKVGDHDNSNYNKTVREIIGNQAYDNTAAEGEESNAVAATGLYKYVDDKIADSESTNAISVDETQFQLSTSAKYQLKMVDGEISIVRYDPLTLSISGLSNVEIDSIVGDKTITPTLGGTNKSTATVTWSVTGGTLETTDATTGATTNKVTGITSPTTCTVTANASDGSSTANGKTTTLKFVPKILWGKSVDAVADDSFTVVDGVLQEKSTISNKSITLSEASYLYFATPYSVGGMYLSNTTSKASLAGGWEKVGTFTKYTSSEKTYNVYRSELKAAGTYRIDVD